MCCGYYPKLFYHFEVRVCEELCKRGFGPFGEISDFLSTLNEIISGKGYFIDDSNEYKFIYVRAQSFLKHGVRQNHFITFCLL